MRICTALLFSLGLAIPAPSQGNLPHTKVTSDIEVIQLSRHCYIHVSYTQMPGWGRVGSNGLTYTIDGELFSSTHQ